MKKSRLTLLVLLSTISVLGQGTLFAQGTIRFNNRITGQVDAPVGFGNRPAGEVPGAIAQLYLIPASGAPVPLFPTTTFRTSSTNAMYYVNEPTEPVTVPGAPAGSTVNIQLRVWIGGATYETASAIGESNIIPLTLGGVLSDGRTVSPAILVGLQGFEVSGNASWFDSIIVRENSVSMDASYRHSFIPARGWILESSADFQSWQPISTNGIGSANLSFELPRNPTESVRIFRLRLY